MKRAQQNSIVLDAPRLTSVLSRVKIDLNDLLSSQSTPVLELAVLACLNCSKTNRCDNWIAANEEGEANPPPPHCPLTVLMKTAGTARRADDR